MNNEWKDDVFTVLKSFYRYLDQLSPLILISLINPLVQMNLFILVYTLFDIVIQMLNVKRKTEE